MLDSSSVNAATAVADTDVELEKGLAQVAEEPPETEELTMSAQKQPVHPRNKTECANQVASIRAKKTKSKYLEIKRA